MKKDYKALVREKLGDKRYTHSINVAEKCNELSKNYRLDPETSEKIYTAGLLHDIMKEVQDFELQVIVQSEADEFAPDPVEVETPKLWHGIAAAKYLCDELKITDPDIVNAVRFHSVARADMSVAEKIVYLADKISDERSFDDVETLRALSIKDLDAAVYSAVKTGIKKTLDKDGRIPVYTIEAYNFYSRQV